MWNIKFGTNEPIYKTKTDSQTSRTGLWWPKGMGLSRGMDWEFGVDRYKLVNLEGIMLLNCGVEEDS